MKTLTLLLTLLLVPFAGAQSKYQTFPIGPNAQPFQVTAVNDSGQVLGWWGDSGEAFVISPGNVWTKNIVKTNGEAWIHMNNVATIIGVEGPSNQTFYKPWGQPPTSYIGQGSTASAINTAGYIAGATPSYSPRGQAELYLADPNVSFVHVSFPHDQWPNNIVAISGTMGLNNLNQVVGSWLNYSTPWSGFFYDSKSKKLNTAFNMPNAVTTYPTSINDNQEVVGNWFDQNGVEHGFYWNPTAGFSDIDVTGDTAMGLIGINNSSVILGWWQDDNTPMLVHYVTIVNGHSTASIHVPNSQAGSTVATAINNVGQVVGEYKTHEGVWRGFIYTPSK
jgi:probable HAF family extracellular repeat protein